MKCRHCNADLTLTMIDLGSSPPSNAYLTEAALHAPETWYPLRVMVCTECWLAQTEDHAGREMLFSGDYAYFSSFSTSWLEHARRYADGMVSRHGLGPASMVVEIAANDGYLLQYVQAHGISCYGIEPTASTAEAARAKGLDIVEEFFGANLARRLAGQGRQADLIAANNVLAHVPDINDFVAGFAILLKPDGVATFEFPHLLKLLDENQFDTIYHEHYSYLSLTAVENVFSKCGLRIFDVEELATHGGSLRVHACRNDLGTHRPSAQVATLLQIERRAGITDPKRYRQLQRQAEDVKHRFLDFLLAAKRAGKTVGGYGAAAKGNTLLNFAGIRPDLLPWVVDRNPAKQGKYMPGSRIPIVDEQRISSERPDFILILPWNLCEEVEQQLSYVGAWGGKFLRAIPRLTISGDSTV